MNSYRIKIIRHSFALALFFITAKAEAVKTPFNPQVCAAKLAEYEATSGETEARFELLLWQERTMVDFLPELEGRERGAMLGMESLLQFQINYYRWRLDFRAVAGVGQNTEREKRIAAANLAREGSQRGLIEGEFFDDHFTLRFEPSRDHDLWFILGDAEQHEIKLARTIIRISKIHPLIIDSIRQYEEFIRREDIPPINAYGDLVKFLAEK